MIVRLQAQSVFILRDGDIELLGVVRNVAQIEVDELRDRVCRMRQRWLKCLLSFLKIVLPVVSVGRVVSWFYFGRRL